MMFTDRAVLNLKPKAERYEEREDNAHGNGTLALRISPNGHKAWQYLYRFGGKKRRLTLGEYPKMSVKEAHAAYGEAMRKCELGVDPGAVAVEANAAERRAPTFDELSKKYLEQHAVQKKDGGDRDRRTLDRDLKPVWGALKAEAIQRKDVRALLQGIVDRGAPIQANRTLALIRKIFNWAMSQDLMTHNPCDRLPAPSKETQSDRVLTDSELRAFLSGLPSAAMSDESKLALCLLLLTAQRCGEVLAVRWDEIDQKNGWWTIPASKAKNKLAHRVPLSGRDDEFDRLAQTPPVGGHWSQGPRGASVEAHRPFRPRKFRHAAEQPSRWPGAHEDEPIRPAQVEGGARAARTLGLGCLYRKAFLRAGGGGCAGGPIGTQGAGRPARRTDGGAEVHHRLREVAGP